MVFCSRCEMETRELGEPFCPACWDPFALLSPPVQHAETETERLSLDRRHDIALAKAITTEVEETFKRFEDLINARTSAVVSMPFTVLKLLLDNERNLYATYTKQVDLGIRKAALLDFDIRRRSVDIALWGSYGESVRTAALSLDGQGLQSYGDTFVRLKSNCIDYRSAVLETNSYWFVETHGLGASGRSRPSGFLATWERRGMLALAKHAGDLENGAEESSFPSIILRDDGTRETGCFLEVHIYGGFNKLAIDDWVPSPAWAHRSYIDPKIRDMEQLFEISKRKYLRER